MEERKEWNIRTIYSTKGAAKEYCDYAVDIYTGCPHGCKYCYASAKAKRKNRDFTDVTVRPHIIEATKAYLNAHTELWGKTIFLGFESDPFPMNMDNTATYEMIKLLKSYGCHIMFCTKGRPDVNLINLLDNKDSVGITITCGEEMSRIYEPNSATPKERLRLLKNAYLKGIETWISIEPVLEPEYIYSLLKSDDMKYVTKVKLGKLNHMNISDLTGNESDVIDWTTYVKTAKDICDKRNIIYIIKDALAEYLDAVFLYEKVRERGHYECYRYKGVEIYSNLNYEWEWSIEEDDGDNVWFASLKDAMEYIDGGCK